MTSLQIEFVGYLASLLLIIAYTQKNIFTLRVINSIGCIFFIVYGFLLDISWPIIITNGFIIVVNAYQIYLLSGKNSKLNLNP